MVQEAKPLPTNLLFWITTAGVVFLSFSFISGSYSLISQVSFAKQSLMGTIFCNPDGFPAGSVLFPVQQLPQP